MHCLVLFKYLRELSDNFKHVNRRLAIISMQKHCGRVLCDIVDLCMYTCMCNCNV